MKTGPGFLAIGVVILASLPQGTAAARPSALREVTAAASPILLVQVKDGEGRYLQIRRGESTVGVYALLPEGDPRQVAFRKMLDANPFARLEIELILAARRYHQRGTPAPAGADPAQWRRALQDPYFVAVEGELEENHWQGFVLRTPAGDEDHLLTAFTGVVAPIEEMGEPWFAGLFLHETGHVILHQAMAPSILMPWGRLLAVVRTGGDPANVAWSPAAFHDIQRTTTRLMALDEALAQAVPVLDELARPLGEVESRNLDARMSLQTARRYQNPRHRGEMIRWNRLVFEPRLPPSGLAMTDGLEAAWAWNRHSLPRDNHRLRSCGTQLATEGAVATILVRLARDRSLQEAPFPPALADRLAPPGVTGARWIAGLAPEGRVLARIVVALAGIPPAPGQLAAFDLGLPELVRSWLRSLPGDAATVIRTVVLSSLGALTSPALAGQIRQLLATPEVIPPRDPRATEVAALGGRLLALADATRDAAALFAGCGGPLWIQVEGRQLCSDFGPRCLPFQADVNAADRMDLLLLPGFDDAKAGAVLSARDRRGFFASMDEFMETAGLSPQDRARIVVLEVPATVPE